MASHSSTLAWKIPWTEEPDRLQRMESTTGLPGKPLFHFFSGSMEFHTLEVPLCIYLSIEGHFSFHYFNCK